MHKLYYFIFIFLSAAILFAQANGAKSLKERIDANKKNLNTEPEKALKENKELLKEAIKQRDYYGELKLLVNQCWYYNYKTEIDSLILTSNYLKQKATEYKKPRFEAEAYIYLSQVYTYNEMYDKAISAFEKAISILNQSGLDDAEVIESKRDAYTCVANTYVMQGDFKMAARMLRQTGKEIEKMEDTPHKKDVRYGNFSNLSLAYSQFDIDSAEYFIKKANEIRPESIGDDHQTVFQNYNTLGLIYLQRKDYAKAIQYFKKVETESNNKIHLINLEGLYRSMIEIYEKTDSTEQAGVYKSKLKDLQLDYSNSKYKSLHKILGNTETASESNTLTYVLVTVFGASVLLILGFYLYKKNKTQEQPLPQAADLIGMLKNNDPAFMLTFEEGYPEFMMKIMSIAPDLSKTEQELCAMLKLKLSTKEIAQMRYISPKTVQNKKNLIRKRLNIPANDNIYKWFVEL